MNAIFPLIVLVLGTLSLLGFGLATLLSPELLAVTGLEVAAAGARTEVRAFYGGLELGLGLLMLAALWLPQQRRAGLWLMFAIFAGIGAGRLVGVLIEGQAGEFHVAALLTEVALAGLAAAALWSSRPRE